MTFKTVRYVVRKASIFDPIEVPLWHLRSTVGSVLMALEARGSALMVCRYVGGTCRCGAPSCSNGDPDYNHHDKSGSYQSPFHTLMQEASVGLTLALFWRGRTDARRGSFRK